jgi:fucose 4-O-acetylase-like acetyltransferase
VIDRAQRYPAIDYLKAAAIVAVTVTHAIGNFFNVNVSPLNKVASVSVAFHVPAFLFAAGFLSARSAAVTPRELGRRLQRLLGPYLVASVVTLVLGYWKADTLRRVVFRLVTGSAMGIYYFVPVLAACYVLLPAVSRMRTRSLFGLVVALLVYAHLTWLDPTWRLTTGFFWGVRDVLTQLHFGNFILGILAARWLAELSRIRTHRPYLAIAVCVVGIVTYVGKAALDFPHGWGPVGRMGYMLTVAGFFACLVPNRPAPAPIRFLSDATLTIYLYHLLVHPLLTPAMRATLGTPLRVVILSALGVALGSLIALGGRRLFGRQSRLLVGY